MSANDNGASHSERPNGQQKITISLDPHTLKLSLNIDTIDGDIALSMLERAHREIEARYRFTRARDLLAEYQQQQSDAALAAKIRGDMRV